MTKVQKIYETESKDDDEKFRPGFSARLAKVAIMEQLSLPKGGWESVSAEGHIFRMIENPKTVMIDSFAWQKWDPTQESFDRWHMEVTWDEAVAIIQRNPDNWHPCTVPYPDWFL